MVVDAPRWRRWTSGWSLAMAIAASVSAATGADLAVPNKPGSLKFAVIGDFGTGDRGE